MRPKDDKTVLDSEGIPLVPQRIIRTLSIMTCMKNNGMFPADMGAKAFGPNYSFSGPMGVSYIDHIMIPDEFDCHVDYCEILQDDIDNVSDHLAILMSCTFPCSPSIDTICEVNRFSWHKSNYENIGNDGKQ